MGLDFAWTEGQSPLEEEEMEGLLIPTITTRAELDEFEQANIVQAIRWTLGRNFRKEEILSEEFVKLAHRKMYGEVWAWAGEFRKSPRNLGVNPFRIATDLRVLLDDCKFWIERGTYPPDEIAVRFKHRIVQIHCFANGNGRHSRLMGDLIVQKIFARPVFTWGTNGDLSRALTTRKEYINALKSADLENIVPLLGYSRK